MKINEQTKDGSLNSIMERFPSLNKTITNEKTQLGDMLMRNNHQNCFKQIDAFHSEGKVCIFLFFEISIN